MEKQLTPLEAFSDFLFWLENSGTWNELTPAEKNRVITARRDRDGKRAPIKLGVERIKSILTSYAPGRYEFREGVIIKEQ